MAISLDLGELRKYAEDGNDANQIRVYAGQVLEEMNRISKPNEDYTMTREEAEQWTSLNDLFQLLSDKADAVHSAAIRQVQVQREAELTLAKKSGGDVTRAIQILKSGRKEEYNLLKHLRGMKTGNWKDAPYERMVHEGNAGFAMDTINAGSGGTFIEPQVSRDIIARVQAAAVIVQAGARIIPMPTGILSVPKQVSGGTIYWLGENVAITQSTPGTGSIELRLRKCAMLYAVSNEWLARATAEFNEIVMQDLVRQMSVEMTRVALRGAGVGNEPRGIKNDPDVTAQSSLTMANFDTVTEINLTRKTVRGNNEDPTGFIFSPRVWDHVNGLAASSSALTLMGTLGRDANAPMFRGLPVHETTLADPAATTSDVYCGDWRELMIGVGSGIQVALSGDAGFASDQTLIRVIMHMDVAARRATAFSYQPLTSVS